MKKIVQRLRTFRCEAPNRRDRRLLKARRWAGAYTPTETERAAEAAALGRTLGML